MVADAPLSAWLGPRCPLPTVDDPDLGRTADVILRISVVYAAGTESRGCKEHVFSGPCPLGFPIALWWGRDFHGPARAGWSEQNDGRVFLQMEGRLPFDTPQCPARPACRGPHDRIARRTTLGQEGEVPRVHLWRAHLTIRGRQLPNWALQFTGQSNHHAGRPLPLLLPS